MKLVLLFATLFIASVAAAEMFPTVDVSEGLDSELQLAGDTPVRQSQRQRQNERAERAAAEAEEAAMEGTSLIESAATTQGEKSPSGPALNRLTGAAKTYHPNDQMCVLCQFLVQRTQLDMAHFNAVAGFVGAKTAGTGGAANAAAGGADEGKGDDAFLEIASGEEADRSADWESEDAEDAELMEIAAKQELAEAAGDWDAVAALEAQAHTVSHASDEEESDEEEEDESEEEEAPAAALSETSSAITAGLSSVEKSEMEAVLNEVHDAAVADSVQQQIAEGMEVTPVLVEAGAKSDVDEEDMVEEEVTVDMVSNGERKSFLNALGEKFDNELNLSADERSDLRSTLNGESSSESLDESIFQSPTYNADGESESLTGEDQVVEAITEAADEDMALLQVDATESDSEDSEDESEDEESEEEGAGGMVEDNIEFIELATETPRPRVYARQLHVAESAPVAPAMAELHGNYQKFQSAGGVASLLERKSRRGGGGRVGIANSPRRFRLADALNGRPRWNRFDPTVAPHPNAQRQQAREMWHRLMQMTYDRLEGYCSTRLPEQFTPFCRPLLRRFRVVAEGIRYGDRPNQICMRTKFCPRGSYVRRSPHNVFKHVSTRR